jgi:L-alanine-DL-glutamate epimerase-like enolase superfamily enzyme
MVNTLGTHPISQYVIVAVTADNGRRGHGEACGSPTWSGEYYSATLEILREVLAPCISQRNPMDLPAIAKDMDVAIQHNPFAKSALEMAILDLLGQEHKVPAYALLGGRSRSGPVRLKFSIGAYPPAEAAKVAEKFAIDGFQAVKVKVGRNTAEDLERVQAVRSAVGDSVQISIDANGGWSESEVLSVLPRLERLGVNAVEEPLRRGDLRATARIRKRTSIPIILDESIFTAQHAIEAVRLEACDLISIYPGKNGGIRRSMEIAHIASAAGMDCVIGSNLEGSVGSAAMLHLAATITNLSTAVGHEIIGPLYHTAVLDSQMPAIKNGASIIPSSPGLGVNVNLEALQAMQHVVLPK